MGLSCSAACAQTQPACRGPQQLEAAVHDHPSVRALAALAGWFGEERQFACAIPAFREALRLDPASASLHYYLGLSLKSAGNDAAALDELRRSIQLDDSQLEPLLLEGVILNESARRGEAEEVWETALRLDPTSVIALDWLAKARIADEQFEAAIDLLTAAPRDEELTLDLAVAYSRNGQFDKAAYALNEALGKSPGNLRLATALATVYVQSHRYQDATELVRTALASHPRDAATEMLYLELLVMQDDETEARPLAERMLLAHPKDFEALYLSGILDVDAQDYFSAVKRLRTAVALNPNHYDARYNLGIALSRLQQNEAAREELAKAVTLDPSQAQAHFHLAQVLRALGRNDEAQVELKLFQERQQATVQLALGQTKAGQAAQALKDGQADQAVALYREANAAQPDNASYQYDLAVALGVTGDVSGERSSLVQSLKLNPHFPLAENLLGTLEAQAGETASAERHFRAALEAAPRYADAANNLGTLLATGGRDTEAEVRFRSAVSANPRFTQAWVNLAAVLAGESRIAEASSAVENALKVDPQDADALRLRQMLATVLHGTGAPISPKSGPGPGPVQVPR